jgi:hypothetical protein
MAKVGIFKLSALLICLVLLSGECFAHQSPTHTRKQIVESFLKTWLVQKDVSSALKFFHEKAVSDGFVIDCAVAAKLLSQKQSARIPKQLSASFGSS